ncbi:MAG TPA: hypothetical protein VJK02_20145 [Anaerolineales bacterium]|nr:hypothetical protein [Anaerolineales bacterium]
MQRSTFLTRNATSLSLLVALIVAGAIVFYLEFTLEVAGPNDDKLFGALEFFLSVAIGWVGQSIAAREDLQRSLRQYAISAYRRISDIRRSVYRMHKAIERVRKHSAQAAQDQLQTLRAIADEMSDTAWSSALDWADIIGPDLDKVQRIHELQERIRISPAIVVGSGEEEAQSRTEIKEEIEKLRSDLPYLLQVATIQEEDMLPREGRFSPVVESYLRHEIGAKRAIDLPVYFGRGSAEEARQSLSERGPISLMVEQNMFHLHLGVQDRDGNLLFEISNPLDGAGVYHNDFVVTLLPHIQAEATETPGGGPTTYSVASYEILPSSLDGVDFYFRVPARSL